jgi:TonB family protein
MGFHCTIRFASALALALLPAASQAKPARQPAAPAVLPAPVPPDLTGADPHWSHDANGTCWAYRKGTDTGFTLTWSGTCKDKLVDGVGVLHWLYGVTPIETLEGHFVAGRMQGPGKWQTSRGVTYEGMFHDGVREGQGRMTYHGDSDEGSFAGGYMDGRGKRTFANGDMLEAEFIAGRPTGNVTFRHADGATTTGAIVLSSTDPQIKPWPIHYPEMSIRLGEEGYAQVTLVVTSNGGTRDIHITQSTGYQRLDDAALDYVRSWMFLPATIGGKPVEMETDRLVDFKIPR